MEFYLFFLNVLMRDFFVKCLRVEFVDLEYRKYVFCFISKERDRRLFFFLVIFRIIFFFKFFMVFFYFEFRFSFEGGFWVVFIFVFSLIFF